MIDQKGELMERSKLNWNSLRELVVQNGQKEAGSANLRKALLKRGGAVQGMFEGLSRKGWLQDYNTALHSCIDAADRIAQIRPEYKKQSIVLENYYQRDKLLDYLEQLVAFSCAEFRPADTGEKLAVKGYSNYLFVIRCTFQNMEEKIAGFEMPPAEEPMTARAFLRQESAGEPLLVQWQQLHQKIAQTLNKPAVPHKEYVQRLQELDEIEVSLQCSCKNAAAFLTEKAQVLLQRKDRMEEEIRTAKALYLALSQLLNEDLFKRFDPDAGDEWSLDVAQTKQIYRELAQQIQQILEQFPRR